MADADPDDAFDAVLLFHGECPFCSAAATALRRLRGAGSIPWEDDRAQAFLRAQFDATPFALVFADRDAGRVWIGREAARELCERAGLPVLVGDLVGENYEAIADAVRTASGVDREPDPYHDAVDMTAAARERFAAMAAAAESATVHLEDVPGESG